MTTFLMVMFALIILRNFINEIIGVARLIDDMRAPAMIITTLIVRLVFIVIEMWVWFKLYSFLN